MVKYAFGTAALLVLSNWTGLSIAGGRRRPFPSTGLQVVYEQNDSTANWSASLDNWLPKIHSHGQVLGNIMPVFL